MKKFICAFIIMMMVLSAAIGTCIAADKAKNYKSAEEVISAYENKDNYEVIRIPKDFIKWLYTEYDEPFITDFMRNTVIQLKENEEGMYYTLESGEYPQYLLIIYDIAQKDLENYDKEIIRVAKIEFY